MARREDVRTIISDPGSQLQGASKELLQWRKGWDQDKLIRYGAEKSLQWKFIMAAFQHQNGGAESLVKVVKGIMKSLMHSLSDTKLSLNELNTLLDECANLANERPIGQKPNNQTDPEYLSPNSLLLGRCSARISAGPFESADAFDENPDNAKTSFVLVQRITVQFWKVWQKLYFPTLLIRQKWHHQKRNLEPNDVCLLQDSNNLRGEWRLCRVVEVHPDEHGVVRNVHIEVAARYNGSGPYKFQKPYTLNRHVSKLIVLATGEDEEKGDNKDV